MATLISGAALNEKTIFIPDGQTAQGAISAYIVLLAQSLGRLAPVRVFDYRNPSEIREVLDVITSTKGCTYLTVCAVGTLAGTQQIFEQHEVRYLDLEFDHPCHLVKYMRQAPKGAMTTFATADMVPFAKLLCQGLQHGFGTIAHGACLAEPLPWSKRTIPCLIAANLSPAMKDEKNIWRDKPAETRNILETMREIYQENSENGGLQLDEIAVKALRANSRSDVEMISLCGMMSEFDVYIRQRARFDLVSCLREAEVTVVGKGWEGFESSNLNLLGPRTPAEVDELTARSKVVLNLSANYHLSHERVFSGMAHGAAVVSYGGGILANALGKPVPDDPISYATPSTLDSTIMHLLSDDGACKERGEAGNRMFVAGHTWDHRAERIVELLGQ